MLFWSLALSSLHVRGMWRSLDGHVLAIAAHAVNRMGREEDFSNFLLMHAIGADTAGQIGSVMAGGVILTLLG